MCSAVPFSFCSGSVVFASSICYVFACPVVFLPCIFSPVFFVSFSSFILSLSCIISFVSNSSCSVATDTGNLFCWLFCIILPSLLWLLFATFCFMFGIYILVQLSWYFPSVFIFVSCSIWKSHFVFPCVFSIWSALSFSAVIFLAAVLLTLTSFFYIISSFWSHMSITVPLCWAHVCIQVRFLGQIFALAVH